MVRLHVKRGDESQFLLHVSGSARLADLAPLVARIYNGRLKVQRLCSGTGTQASAHRQPISSLSRPPPLTRRGGLAALGSDAARSAGVDSPLAAGQGATSQKLSALRS